VNTALLRDHVLHHMITTIHVTRVITYQEKTRLDYTHTYTCTCMEKLFLCLKFFQQNPDSKNNHAINTQMHVVSTFAARPGFSGA